MATRVLLSPLSAVPNPAVAPAPIMQTVNGIPVLAYDASTAKTTYWRFVAPQGLTGTLSMVLKFMIAATTGKVDWTAAVQAVTPLDALNLSTTTSFDTANALGSGVTVPGSAYNLFEITITLTNADALAAGDWVTLSLTRDATDATNDTAAGDCYYVDGEFRDAA